MTESKEDEVSAPGKRMSPLRVRWRQYDTAEKLVKGYFRGIAKANGFTLRDVVGVDDHLKAVEHHGMWAYVDTFKSPPVVHYWCDHSTSLEDLAYMLGHELGHASGKQYRSDHAEEDRADTYGAAAMAVMLRLRQ
jgi:hypothetical protein